MTHTPIDLNLKVSVTLGSPGFSLHKLYRSLGLDYEEELKKMKQERIKQLDNYEGMIFNPYSNKWSYL